MFPAKVHLPKSFFTLSTNHRRKSKFAQGLFYFRYYYNTVFCISSFSQCPTGHGSRHFRSQYRVNVIIHQGLIEFTLWKKFYRLKSDSKGIFFFLLSQKEYVDLYENLDSYLIPSRDLKKNIYWVNKRTFISVFLNWEKNSRRCPRVSERILNLRLSGLL